MRYTKDWELRETFSNLEDLEVYLAANDLSRNLARNTKTGVKVQYRCRHAAKYNCAVAVYVLYPHDSQIKSVYWCGDHKHVDKISPGGTSGVASPVNGVSSEDAVFAEAETSNKHESPERAGLLPQTMKEFIREKLAEGYAASTIETWLSRSVLSPHELQAFRSFLRKETRQLKVQESIDNVLNLSLHTASSSSSDGGRQITPESGRANQSSSTPSARNDMEGFNHSQLSVAAGGATPKASPLNSLLYKKILSSTTQNKSTAAGFPMSNFFGSTISPLLNAPTASGLSLPTATSYPSHPYGTPNSLLALQSLYLKNSGFAMPKLPHGFFGGRYIDDISAAGMQMPDVTTKSGPGMGDSDEPASASESPQLSTTHSASDESLQDDQIEVDVVDSLDQPLNLSITTDLKKPTATSIDGHRDMDCVECAIYRDKLVSTESRNHFLKTKVIALSDRIARLEGRNSKLEVEATLKMAERNHLQNQCEGSERAILDIRGQIFGFMENSSGNGNTDGDRGVDRNIQFLQQLMDMSRFHIKG